jgi:hypothetical protein
MADDRSYYGREAWHRLAHSMANTTRGCRRAMDGGRLRANAEELGEGRFLSESVLEGLIQMLRASASARHRLNSRGLRRQPCLIARLQVIRHGAAPPTSMTDHAPRHTCSISALSHDFKSLEQISKTSGYLSGQTKQRIESDSPFKSMQMM